MPGTNAGTGEPISFQCWCCRRQNRRRASGGISRTGYLDEVTLIHNYRLFRHCGARMGLLAIGYRCRRCGHHGYSRHVDIIRRWFHKNDGWHQSGMTLREALGRGRGE